MIYFMVFGSFSIILYFPLESVCIHLVFSLVSALDVNLLLEKNCVSQPSDLNFSSYLFICIVSCVTCLNRNQCSIARILQRKKQLSNFHICKNKFSRETASMSTCTEECKKNLFSSVMVIVVLCKGN